MATINYEQILENINTRGSKAFAFPKNKYFLLLIDEQAALNYINSISFGWNDILQSARPDTLINFDRTVSNADAKFADYQKAFYNLTNGVTSPSSVNTNNVGVIESGSTKLIFLSLDFDAKINILQTGLGKNYDWCKIRVFDSIDGSTSRIALCKQEDIIKVSETTKEFIKYDFAEGILSGDIKQTKLLPINSSLSFTINYNTQKNVSTFDDQSAANYIVINTGLVDYSTLNDESVTSAFNVAFIRGIEQILKANKRKLITKNGENVWDKYICFGYLQSYFLSSRATQGLSVCVVVPYRNMMAVTESDRTILENISDRTENLINNVAVVADVVSKAQETYSIDLTEDLGSIGSAFQSLGASTDLPLNNYIDPSREDFPEQKRVYFENDKQKFLDIFKKLYTAVQNTDDNIQKYLSDEKNEGSEFYINLLIYLDAINSTSDALNYLLFQKNANPNYKFFTLIFNKGILSDVKFLSENGPVDVENSTLTIESISPDLTLSVLLLNIFDIAEQSTNKNGDISAAVKFLKKYIAPKELAEVKLANGPSKTNKECWDDIKSDLAKQAKKRAEKSEKATTEPIKNSVENIKKETKDDEFKKILKDTEKAFKTKLAAGALSYKSIKWNQLIFQITACIKDKESREFAEKALLWLKDYDTSQSLLCQIPSFQIPQFPEIKIPEIPSIRSIFSVAADSSADLLLSARDEIVKSILQSFLELSGFCDAPPLSDKAGDTPAENMMDNTNASANKKPDLQDQEQQDQRKDQFLKANIFDSEDNVDAKTYETRLLLSKVSEGLTKKELIFLFNGSAGNTQYDIVKNVVEALNSDNKIPNIYKSVNTKLTALNFFSRFGKLLRPDVYESLTRQDSVNTSYNTRFLCNDQTDYESSLIDDLLKRGLSEEQAAAEIYKRRDDLRKLVDNFTKSVNLLNKQEVKVQPANCTKNPDGSTTPGTTAKAGLPDPILRLNEKMNDQLFINFEKAYSEEIKTFADLASETSSSANNNIVTKNTIFLETPIKKAIDAKSFSFALEDPFIVFSTNIGSFCGQYNKSERAEQEFEEKRKLRQVNPYKDPYYLIFNSSNPIRYITNVKYITSSFNSNIVSSSVNIYLNSTAEKVPSIIPDEERLNLIDELSFNGVYITSSTVNTDYNNSGIFNGDLFKKTIVNSYINYLRGVLTSSLFLADYVAPTYGNININNYINNYILNIPYTNVDRKNKIKDLRLINNITDNKKKILDSANEPCNIPEVNLDGTKKLSNSDKSTLFAAYDLLFRLYAIEYSLFSIPFLEYIEYMQNGIFTYACYASFIQDVKNNYGQEFVDSMFVFLGEKYKEEKGIEEIFVSLDQTRFEIFRNYFEEKHLKAVNKQIKDYIFGSNKDNKEYENIQKFNQFFNELRKQEEKDRDNLIKKISSAFSIADDETPALFSTARDTIPALERPSIDESLAEYAKIIEVKTIPDYEFFKKLYQYIYSVSDAQYTKKDIDDTVVTQENPLKIVVKLEDEIGSQITLSKAEDFQPVKKENIKYFLEVQITYGNIRLPAPKQVGESDEKTIAISTPEERALASNDFPTTTLVISTQEISYESAAKLLVEKKFIPELKKCQKDFSDIFTYSVSLDCLYSNFISTFLLTTTSIKTYNNLFDECKNELANIFNVLQKANDYKFEAKENIFAYIKTIAKLKIKASLATAKNVAKQTDPNAAASFKISEAYDLVFGLASSFKVDKYLPVKHIPAYIPSAVLSSIVPPLSPIAAVAIGSTFNDDVLNGGGSGPASSAAKRNK